MIKVFVFLFLQQFYKVVPIKDIRNLYVTFPIPDLQKYYKSNPGHYLGHLIGHEGPGSLLSELKSKGNYVNRADTKMFLISFFSHFILERHRCCTYEFILFPQVG